GVDSSAVAWAVAERKHGPTDAFAIGFDSAEFDETPGATEVARELALPLHVLRAGDELLSDLPRAIRHADQPPGAASFLPLLARARGTDPISQTLFVDTTLLLPGNNLVKADRMGMACGLELRCPFLDYRLVELAFTIPGSDRIANGEGKRPLREMLAPVLPS